MHLSPTAYERLQRHVHGDHTSVVRLLTEQLGLKPGDTVVEVGSGTGSLARTFLRGGFDYWGIEPDQGRVSEARTKVGDRFLVGDATKLAELRLPSPRHFFVHGVLHHLDDRSVREVLEAIRTLSRSDFLVSEPVRPDRWWTNPLGELFTRFDEGAYPRRQDEWLDLAGRDSIGYARVRSLWPRWPVAMLDMRIRRA
jgi:ubiquinone/menaquinone biosynthesis C-methylase UbiE